MNILGINAYCGEASVVEGQLVGAVEEEWFIRL
jgi:hypothetical protein